MNMLDDIIIDEQDELDNEIIEVPKEVRKLRTQPYDKSIIDLIGMIERKEMILNPDFQRNMVWDNKKASQLIESVWLNIPIPQVFVSVEEDGCWVVIDGQQRLTSLYRFYKNEFSLRGLEVLTELNKEKYSTLEDKARRLFNGGNIRIVAIHEDSHPDIKFDIFMRINQGAVQLNDQELRNCMFRGSLNSLLHELALNSNLLEILNLEKPHKRFKDLEIILRYFSLSASSIKSFEDYPSVMKKFLNDFMRENANIQEKELNILKTKFEENIKKVYVLFGKNSFKKWNSLENDYDTTINLSLMDCSMLVVERYSLEQIEANKNKIVNDFKKIFENIDDNAQFLDSITSGTSAKNKLLTRIEFMKSFFESKII